MSFVPDALQNFTGGNFSVVGPNATAGIWATYPSEGISNGIGFVDQVGGSKPGSVTEVQKRRSKHFFWKIEQQLMLAITFLGQMIRTQYQGSA